MASVCKFCVCELARSLERSPTGWHCVCELPPLPPIPALTRQTNQVPDLEPDFDEHKGCEDEPCAYCLPAWKDELERLKTLDYSPFIAFRIREHEKRVLAGALRAAREHERCEEEPCADCLQVCKNELARLKSLPAPMSPFTAFSIGYYESRVILGEMRACELFALPERQTNEHPLNYAPLPLRTGTGPAPLHTKEERDAIKERFNKSDKR